MIVRLLIAGEWRSDATLRKTRSGEYTLQFPMKRARSGRLHLVAGPIDRKTKQELLAWLLLVLGLTAPLDAGVADDFQRGGRRDGRDHEGRSISGARCIPRGASG